MNATALRARYDKADEASAWPVPDMTILGGGRTTPPVIPTEMFGNLWPLINDLAAGAGAPVDYVALGMLSVAASLIGGKRRVQPFATAAQWAEPCILWVGLVGDPSSNKSPAIDAAVAPLPIMEGDHAETHKTKLMHFETVTERAKAEAAAWKKQVETATKDGVATPPMPLAAVLPDEPQRRRLLVQDATPEAVGAILAGNPNGTLHLRDELAGWLSSFERYSPGGREMWLEAYGGRSHVIDRKGAKAALRISFNGVSVLGGIQPEKLADCLLSGADDGLVGRFLWAWPNAIPYHRPRSIADKERLERVYRRLEDLESGKGPEGEACPIVMVLDDQAGDIFESWVAELAEGMGDAASLFKSFCGKLKGTVLRLSLVTELLAWADSHMDEPPTSVSAATVIAAIEFVETYAKPTALRVFGDAALPPVQRNAAMLARYIQRENKTRINARDLKRTPGLPSMKTTDVVDETIDELVEADWLRAAPSRAGAGVGRAKKDFLVNPAVHWIAE